jgi:hypothetical protein
MSQPVNAAPARESPQQEDLSGPPAANRHRLPDERVGLTHHFSIAGHEGYLTAGTRIPPLLILVKGYRPERQCR